MSAPLTTATPSANSKASGTSIATKIFVDQVPEYALLQKCAEMKVSAIVRGMASGCGDGSQMTSYACFCYSSSTYYESMIGGEVGTACDDNKQITSAQDVFHKYCQLGQTKGIAPNSVSASVTSAKSQSTLLPTSSANTISATTQEASSTSTPLSLSTASPKVTSGTNITAIAVGVTVPIVVVIAVLVAAFFFYRHRKQSRRTGPVGSDVTEKGRHDGQDDHGASMLGNDPQRVELAGQGKGGSTVLELENTSYTNAAELPGHAIQSPNTVHKDNVQDRY